MATYQELRTRSQQVRDEQNIGGNTALRVGQLLMDIVKFFYDTDMAASEYLEQHFAMVNDGTHLLNWQQSPIVILHTMGDDYDDGDFSALSQGENYYRAGFVMEANGQGGGINGETPKANVLYVNLANDTLYTWNGASFDAITSGGGGGSISGDDILKNAYYLNGNLVLVFDTENGDKTVSIPVNFDASNYVPTSRTVNGKALSSNITLSQSDIPGLVAALAGKISGIKTSDNTPLTPDSNGIVTLPPAGSTISPATAAPSMDGTASVGISDKYAREDHVHPHDSSKQNTLTFDDAPGNTDNPVKSRGIKQAIELVTPTIDANGKWVIGGVTTDKDAQGPRGNTTLVNENAQGIQALIVNNVVDGGETDILSAEMGKVIRQNIMKIFNALGTYAFLEGKPTLNWGSTVINHSINVNGVTGDLTIADVEIDGVSAASLPAQIVEGKSLSLRLALPSNLYVFNDGVSITMGGVDITNNQGVWDESTGVVNIASVTDDVVITATSMTYVQDGLAFQLDCKNRGGQSGHWIDLVDGKDFVLTNVTEADTGMVFSSSQQSKGVVASGGLDVKWDTATIEIVCARLSASGVTPVLTNNLAARACARFWTAGSQSPTSICSFAVNSRGSDTITSPINAAIPISDLNIALSASKSRVLKNGSVVSNPYSTNYYDYSTAARQSLSVGYGLNNNNSEDFMDGTIMAIRVYRSQLSENDQKRNYAIDKKRFNLA